MASLLSLAKVHSQSPFIKITEGAIVTDREASFRSVWWGYDNDGFLDLLITCGNGSRLPNDLYRNNGPGIGNANHWLKVRRVGRASNRSGIGAKVRVKATIAGKEV